jgi:chromosome segregation protein
VTRDSQTTYYLNGTKCRRRDITDIFLGTGLGPRSYSIIEQGMISKLIESKPEDLRNFIEEAAGISKYKERRRETENRIRRTHENLARLTDLRDELERQLERLHRQAEAAKKYQEFKAEERQLKAQLSALRWQDLNDQVGQRESIIGTQEISFEALVAEQRNADAAIERLRDGHHDLSERFNLVQGRFYSVGGDIARVEQSIQHGQQRLRQLQDDLKEAERARLETESHSGPRPHLAADPRRRAGHAHPRAGSHQRRRRRSRRCAGRFRIRHARLAGAVGRLQPDCCRTAPSGRSAAVAHPAAGNQHGASG